MKVEDIYFSSFSGKQVDTMIKALQNMHPQICIEGGPQNSSINCSCIEIQYNVSKTTDSEGKCVFDLPDYGDYIISYTANNLNETVDQPVYEFKRFQIDLS